MWQKEGSVSIMHTYLRENKLHWRALSAETSEQTTPTRRNNPERTTQVLKPETSYTKKLELLSHSFFVPLIRGIPVTKPDLGIQYADLEDKNQSYSQRHPSPHVHIATPVTVANVKYYWVMHGRKIWTLSKALSGGQETILLLLDMKQPQTACWSKMIATEVHLQSAQDWHTTQKIQQCESP